MMELVCFSCLLFLSPDPLTSIGGVLNRSILVEIHMHVTSAFAPPAHPAVLCLPLGTSNLIIDKHYLYDPLNIPHVIKELSGLVVNLIVFHS